MMLDAWETKYNKKRAEGIKLLSSLCEEKIHLNVPFPGGKTKVSCGNNETFFVICKSEKVNKKLLDLIFICHFLPEEKVYMLMRKVYHQYKKAERCKSAKQVP